MHGLLSSGNDKQIFGINQEGRHGDTIIPPSVGQRVIQPYTGQRIPSASLLQQRRQTCLDMTKLDPSLKITLMSQPWATSTLFNDNIADCLKSQQTIDSVSANQRLIKACNAFERMGHTQKRYNPSVPRHQQRKQRTDWKPPQSQPQINKPTGRPEQKVVQKPYTKPRSTSTWKGYKQRR